MSARLQLDTPWPGQTFAPPLRTDLAYIEQRLVAHLKDMATQFEGPLAQVAIDHFPADPETYRLTHPVGEILVIFGASQPTHAPMTVDEVMQEDTLEWHFGVLVRDLGWAYGGQESGFSPGAYGVLDGLRLALLGWQLPGFTKMRMVTRGRFIKVDAGVYHYEARYSHRAVVIQADPDIAYPTLTRINAMERGGQTTVDVPAAAFTFDAGGGIALGHGNVTNVTVTDPSTNAVYVAGEDYYLDAVNGLVLAATGSPLGAGDTVNVAFSYSDIVIAVHPGGPDPTAPTN